MFNGSEIHFITDNNLVVIITAPNPISAINGYRHYLKGKKARALRGRSLVRSLGGDAA